MHQNTLSISINLQNKNNKFRFLLDLLTKCFIPTISLVLKREDPNMGNSIQFSISETIQMASYG